MKKFIKRGIAFLSNGKWSFKYLFISIYMIKCIKTENFKFPITENDELKNGIR